MNTFSQVPPGFRFHPTDEELVDYYLRKKVNNRRIELDVIKDVDLYKIEPWDLQEICKIGSEEQQEWYFFSHKDKKYPTGTRTNRATAAGFWKATGRDKAIYAKHELIGMRKTLVFYKGRAPNGQKSDWIMHEYRLETDENGPTQEEGWVVCRAFKKKIATIRTTRGGNYEHESPTWYNEDQVSSFMQDSFMVSSPSNQQSPLINQYSINYPCKKEYQIPPDHFFQLPLLESPKPDPLLAYASFNVNPPSSQTLIIRNQEQAQMNLSNEKLVDEHVVTTTTTTDWRVLDKFVASQLSNEEMSNQVNNFQESDDLHIMNKHLDNQQLFVHANVATTSTSSPIDHLWK